MLKFFTICLSATVIGWGAIANIAPLLGLAQESPDRGGIQLEPIASDQTMSQRRVALVIGNSHYITSAPLRNPVNDATDMAAVLETLGFNQVILATDADLAAMERALEQFYEALRQGGVGVFYYAGHGLQAEGENYLVPIDANIQVEQDVRSETLALDRVLGRMEAADNDMNIIILDACRDNPFARSWRSAQRGLAIVDAPQGLVIAYATAPGDVAADGTGRNGTYTAALLQRIGTPKEHILNLFNRVSNDVAAATNNRQVPYMTSARVGDFAFNPTNSDEGITLSALPDSGSPVNGPAAVNSSAANLSSPDPLDPNAEAMMLDVPTGHWAAAAIQRVTQSVNSSSPDLLDPNAEAMTLPDDRSRIITLRQEPATLTREAVKVLLIKNKFYDKRLNPGGQGIVHRYEAQISHDAVVVVDAATGLMWQHGGSPDSMTFDDAAQYIEQLNADQFGGFSDWRLPTVEESMSLMEPQPYNNFHISPEFEQSSIPFIWTADAAAADQRWMLYFYDGTLDTERNTFNAWVRAVRRR